MCSHSRVPVVALVVGLLIPLAAPGFAQGSAPGAPIFDCTNAAARHYRMGSGLGVQDDAIRRTKAQIAGLEEARDAESREARQQLVQRSLDTIRSHAADKLGAMKKLQQEAMGLPANAAEAAARKTWAGKLLALQEAIDNLNKLAGSYDAGKAYGKALQEQSHTVVEDLIAADKAFVDSGLAEEIGSQLAKAGGPLGVMAFEASLFALDYAVADMDAFNRQLELNDLKDTLSNLERGRGNVELKMEALVNDCPAEFGRDTGTKPPETASTSLTPPLPEPPAPQTPEVSASRKKGGSGGKAAVVVLGTGVAVGGALYAGKLAGDLATMSAGSCVSSRNCIVSVMGHGCDCAGSVNGGCDWTGPTAGSGEGCGAGTPCAANLSCNNGRCEGASGRCPF
jgi:hypothetical protein